MENYCYGIAKQKRVVLQTDRDEAQDVERRRNRHSHTIVATASERGRPAPAFSALLCARFEQLFGCDFNGKANAVDPSPRKPAPPARSQTRSHMPCAIDKRQGGRQGLMKGRGGGVSGYQRSCHSPTNVKMIHMLHICVRRPPKGMYLGDTQFEDAGCAIHSGGITCSG